MKLRDSILARILKWSLIAALVPLLANQVAQYFSVRVGLGRSAQERVDMLAEQKFLQIERFLSERKGNVAVLSRLAEIQTAIQGTLPISARKPPIAGHAPVTTASLRQSLATCLSAYDYEDVLLVSGAGNLVFSMANRPELGTNLRTGPHRDTVLAKAVEMCRTEGTTVFSDFRVQQPTGRLALFVVAPLVQGRQTVGFVATEIKGENILRLIQDFSALGKTGEVVLLSQEGLQVRVLTPLREPAPELPGGVLPETPGVQSVARKAVGGESGSGMSVDFLGTRCVAWWRYLPATRWGVLVKIDEAEAYARLNLLAKRTALLTAGAVLLAGLLSLGAARGISRPILELKKGVQQITAGDFGHRVGMTTQDEIGSLSRTFDKMLDRLQELTASRDELNAEIERRKQVEADNRRLVLAVRETTNVVMVSDAEGRVEWANEAFTRLTGFSVEEVKGKRPGDFLQGAATDPAAKARIRKSLQRGKGVRTELLNYRKDRTPYWVDVNIQPMLDQNGQLEGWFAIEVDITERKAAEEELRLHAEKLHEQMAENDRFNRLTADREHRILELKEQVNTLAKELGREPLFETTAVEASAEAATEEPSTGSVAGEVPAVACHRPAELVDKVQLQILLEEFCHSVGVSGAILDPDGGVLASTSWHRVCAGGHKEGEETCKLCEPTGPGVLEQLVEGKDQALCRFPNKMAEAGAVVMCEDNPVAFVMVGPFHSQKPDLDALREQARQLSLDTPEYLSAVAEAPVVSPDRLPSMLGFLRDFTRLRVSASVERQRVREAEAAAARRTEELRKGRAAAMSLAEDAVHARAERARYQENLEQLNAELESRIRQRTADLEERSRELQRENEERLKAEERTRLILNSAGEGIFGVDVRGKITFVNAAAKQLLGYTDQEMLGRVVHDLIHHSHADGTRYSAETCPMSHSYTHGEPSQRSDEVLWRKDGTFFPVEYSATPMRNERGLVTGAVVVFRDITVRRRMESELITAKESAEMATAAKSDFLANMSHEIRTPMNGIIGMVHLALRTELTSRQRDYLVKIERSGEQLLSIINDILDFSKIEAGRLALEKVDFELDEVLDNLSSLIGGKASEKGLELLFDCDPQIPPVLVGDPLRLGQILINLASNAVKFTERGEVIIRSQLLQTEGQTVRVRFEVQDTGIGLAVEEKNRLFQAFTQADTSTTRRFGGTGLGLAICRRLVDLMDGEIGVESEQGKGSIFWFQIPIQASQKVLSRPESARALDLKDLRVLVVDDAESARESFADMVKSLGAVAATADSGPNALLALEEAETAGQPFGLVLSDWRMPEMDGLELARRIQRSVRIQHRPRIIIVTAHEREDLFQKVKTLKLDGTLLKPVSLSSLQDAILGVVAAEAPRMEEGNAAQMEAVAADAAEQALAGTRLLVVEDNPINQQIAQEILQSRGAVVTLADNGRMALQSLRKEAFDLVLMDVQMPEMDGYQATAEIRVDAALKQVPVIAMTAHAMTADREKCLGAGMNDYVTKPIDPDKLVSTVLRWLPKQAPLPEPCVVTPASVPEKVEVEVEPQAPEPPPLAPVIEPEAELEPEPELEPQTEPLPEVLESTASVAVESVVPLEPTPPAEPVAPVAEEPAELFPAKLAGIRVEEGLRRLGGSQEVYARLLQEFAKDQGSLLDRIQESLDVGDLKSAVVQAHSLKGSAGNLAMPELARTAASLESCLKNQETLWLSQTFREVEIALEEVLQSIAQLPVIEVPVVARDLSQPEMDIGVIDRKKAVRLLGKLQARFEAGDLDAKLLLPDLVAACGGLFREEIATIQRHLDVFDFEQASAMATALRDKIKESGSGST